MSQVGHAEDTNRVLLKDSHGTITHAEMASCSWFQPRSIKRMVRCKQFFIRVDKVASKCGGGGAANSLMDKITTLREVLEDIDTQPWDFALFLPHGVDWNLDTSCAVLNPDNFENEPNPDRPKYATDHGLRYALGIQVIKSIVENAQDQRPDATTSDLVDAFTYYYDNDAYIDWSRR